MTRARDVATLGGNPPVVAGKNAIINGAFDFWQRGDSLTQTDFTSGRFYLADRLRILWNAVPVTVTVSRQTFAPGSAPVSGYEATNFLRSNIASVGSNTIWGLQHRIEDVRTFAGQTATFSFWAKADSARTIAVVAEQNFGTSGSATVSVLSSNLNVTASWTRYLVTIPFPSVTGKTIGASSFVEVSIRQESASGSILDTWGWQLEAGSVATPFSRAAGTLAGELAACQRYYYRQTSPFLYAIQAHGVASSTTNVATLTPFPVSMRTAPTSIDYANLVVQLPGTGVYTTGAIGLDTSITTNLTGGMNVTASGLTRNQVYWLCNNNTTAGYLGFSAEL